jgi:flagellar hook-associated protein 2
MVSIPGMNSNGFDSQKIVAELMKVERRPIEQAQKRKETIEVEKQEVKKLQTMLTELDSSLNGLKSKADFYKLKVESSHPDIIDGVVDSYALPGSYEFEIRGMARTEKHLAYGFPDRDETPVGFGFMLIEQEDSEPLEVPIEPGSTLQDVANQINDKEAGVRAMVINTKFDEDPFRLLIISEKSGKESNFYLDEDTTFLEFKEQVVGRNLDLLFEDVPITDEDNNVEELLDGVSFQVKRAEPGTRVQVNIAYDVEAAMEGIKGFVEKYNAIANFIHEQFIIDGQTKRGGVLAGDSSIRMILRQLQGAVGGSIPGTEKFSTLSQVGITTDPKTGSLNLDETKLKSALAEDFPGVAKLFIQHPTNPGAAERLAVRIRAFRDPGSGVLRSKVRALDRVIKNQDDGIERQERLMEQKEGSLKRRFGALEGLMANAQSQKQFLSSRFGQTGK